MNTSTRATDPPPDEPIGRLLGEVLDLVDDAVERITDDHIENRLISLVNATKGKGDRVPTRALGTRSPDSRSGLDWLKAAAIFFVIAVSGILIWAPLRLEPASNPDRPLSVAAHHYWFIVPDGWQPIGRNSQFREVDLRPINPALTVDRIIVAETELSYDTDANRGRAIQELRDGYERQAESGQFYGFDPSASVGGRVVVSYTETVPHGTVDWYVTFRSRYQINLGCQHDDDGVERVLSACAQLVSTLIIGDTE